jgi:hypothetical protein
MAMGISELVSRVDFIEGWLAPPAGMLAIYMARVQDRLGIRGPMLEIGVHKGKFLALMRGMTKDKIAGVQLCDPAYSDGLATEIRNNITRAQGFADPFHIIMSDSSKLSTDDVSNMLGSQLRLAHIDGSHEADYVHHDLSITAPLIREGGLMIMDDSFNSGTPGVIEGICRYFFCDSRLKPFAQCYNKLFATTPSHQAAYLDAAKTFLEHDAPSNVRENTLQRMKENRSAGYTPTLFGSEIAIFI